MVRLMFTARMLGLALLASATFSPSHAASPTPETAGQAWTTQYRGLSAEDAAAVIGKLKEAQDKLRQGERLTFELLSGAPAFYEMNGVPPREAFLNASFDQPFSVRKLPPENQSWNPYRIELLPNGTGQLMWDVEVILGFYGEISRVEMYYRPPLPF